MVQYRHSWAADTAAATDSSCTLVSAEEPKVMLALLALTASIAAELMDMTLMMGGFCVSSSLIQDMARIPPGL